MSDRPVRSDLIEAYILRLIRESTPEKAVWDMEKVRAGKPTNWNYINGCMMTGLLALTDITGDDTYAAFAESFVGAFIDDTGAIRTFEPSKHTLDDINEGRALFALFERTGNEKYRRAADNLMAALRDQPRTHEGSFWHKEIYPNQVWLDGIYMAMPFYALYEKTFGTGDYEDILSQIETVEKRMRDSATGLFFHGYDASKTAFWADPETGLSQSFWLRAIGWFSVALADLCEILPTELATSRLKPLFSRLCADLLPFADPDTGLYYQVVNRPDLEGNYLESSGSAMIAYAQMKGARLGFLDSALGDAGEKTFRGLTESRLSFTDGELNLGGICLVAGLGPENNRRRDGTPAYYLSEPVVENDAKGVAPFLLCYTEFKRRNN